MSEEAERRTGEKIVPPKGYQQANKVEVLPWSHAEQRLADAENYWLATTRRDGSPHVVPVWGVWVRDRFYFDGIPTAQWAKNIARNPAASIHLESGTDVVIVDGQVIDLPTIDDPEISAEIVAAWTQKYGRLVPDTVNDGVFCLVPRTVRAWSRFPDDLTRWTFTGKP